MRRLIMSTLVVSVLALLAYCVMAQPPGGRRSFGPSRFPMMNTLDANSDGEISATELENAAEALKKIDANMDGKLTWDEMFTRPGSGPGQAQRPRPGRPPAGESGELLFQGAPVPKDDTEKKILAVLKDLDQKYYAGRG